MTTTRSSAPAAAGPDAAGDLKARDADMIHVRNALMEKFLYDGANDKSGFDEYSLSKRLCVGRAAVRRALSSLVEAGLVRRARRVGTAPVNASGYFDVGAYTTFTAPRSGYSFRTRGIVTREATQRIAADLGVDEGMPVTVISRTTYLGTSAVSHWTIWTPLDLGEYRSEREIPTHLNWYEFVNLVTGIEEFTSSHAHFGYLATEADACVLDVEAGRVPLQFAARLTRGPGGAVIDRSFGSATTGRLVTREVARIRVGTAAPGPAAGGSPA